jgi:hypothetical protein
LAEIEAPHYGHALRVSVEEHVIYLELPWSGKTGTLAGIIAATPPRSWSPPPAGTCTT